MVSNKKNPTTKFSKNILRSLIGAERANNAFMSLSMQDIPSNQGKALSIDSNDRMVTLCSASEGQVPE